VDVIQRVREFIVEDLSWDGPPEALTEDYHLITNKVLDSLAIVQIVTMLEEEYDTEIDDSELVKENFATLTAIKELLDRKMVV
jgi:acyl carrier protein